MSKFNLRRSRPSAVVQQLLALAVSTANRHNAYTASVMSDYLVFKEHAKLNCQKGRCLFTSSKCTFGTCPARVIHRSRMFPVAFHICIGETNLNITFVAGQWFDLTFDYICGENTKAPALWNKASASDAVCLSSPSHTQTDTSQLRHNRKTNTFHPVDVHFFSPVYMKNIFGQFHAKNVVVLKYFCVTLIYQWLIAITRNNMRVIELGSFPLSLSRQANQLLPARRFILSRQT